MITRPSRNVLVLGDNDLAALAIVRSLGRAGLNVHLAVWESKRITRHSRYVHQRHDLGHPISDSKRFVENVLRLLKERSFDLVLPSSDKSLVPLMACRQALQDYTNFVAPDENGFRITNNKSETIALAKKLGIDTPFTTLIRDARDLTTFCVPSAFPVALKPVSSHLPGQERNEVRIVRSAEELHHRLPDMLLRSPVLVQEFCPGHGMGLSVLAKDGEITAAFQHLRVHEPPEGGAASYRRSVALSPDLLRAVRGMCEAMKWSGPAMFEFKHDPVTMRTVLMEINGRFWGSLALAIQSGVDFPRLLYETMVLGHVTPTFDYHSHYFVRHTLRDMHWLWVNFHTPAGRADLLKVGWKNLVKEAWNILALREGYDLESLTDPLPGLLAWCEAAAVLKRHVVSRIEAVCWRFKARRANAAMQKGALSVAKRLRSVRTVLILCHGNVNRSALAATRLRNNISGSLVVRSAGFYPASGRCTSEVSLRAAKALSIDLAEHRSTAVSKAILDGADLILVMESAHLRALAQIDRNYLGRTFLLSAFDEENEDPEILDPQGKSLEAFDLAYRRILRCVDRLTNHLSRDYSQATQTPWYLFTA